uniref:Uncharacterized protein n=1 Tax=Acrobeloides nanus TaxID=290746 RepID=A0A914EGQ1_9BILA
MLLRNFRCQRRTLQRHKDHGHRTEGQYHPRKNHHLRSSLRPRNQHSVNHHRLKQNLRLHAFEAPVPDQAGFRDDHKSHGQTFECVSVDLIREVFSHGQLYVAFSRVRRRAALKMLLDVDCQNRTKNIVDHSILQGAATVIIWPPL